MKLLFICSTELQLFNALNLKMHMFPSDEADIILQFLKTDTVDFYHRVKEIDLFKVVCYRLPDLLGLHEYSRRIRSGDFSCSFLDAVRNTVKQLYVQYFSSERNEFVDAIKDKIFNFGELDLKSYQQAFVGGTNEIVVSILKYIRYHNCTCQVNLYEEGVGSYVHENLGADSNLHVDNVYLYEPCLALYNHISFVRIPKISRNDTKFKSIVNHVFDYHEEIEEIKNKIIFFDNYAEPMPAYLNKSRFLSKTIFRNTYKKHLRDHQLYMLQLKIYKLLVKYANGRDLFLKLHPRTERQHIEADYMETETKILKNISVPWEVFCCNCEISNNIFVTLVSSAVLSNAFVLDEDDHNKSIVLVGYKNVEPNLKYKEFFRKFKDNKVDYDFYLPTNECQFVSALQQCLNDEE